MLYGGAFLIFVPLNLTSAEQGVWFTLMALGAMSRLADMGFLQLVLTYSGHAKFSDELHRQEIIYFTSRWRSRVVILAFPIIFLIGLIVLSFRELTWLVVVTWAWYVFALTLVFYLNFILARIEGEGDVVFSHSARGSIYFLGALFTACGLSYLHSLTALPLGIFLGVLVILISVYRKRPKYFFQNNLESSVSVVLKRDFVNLFKQTSLSWTGGYLGTHAIVPIIYVFVGATASGLAGMTLNIFLAIQNFSNVFLISVIPKVTESIALNSKIAAQKILKVNLLKTLVIFVIGVSVFTIIVNVYPESIISKRVFNDVNVLFLAFGFCFQIVIFAIAVYIRAHKVEPFSLMSLVTSLIGLLILIYTLNSDYSNWVFLGFLCSSILALLWSVRIVFDWKRDFE